MDITQVLTPQVLNAALLIMQKATVTGDQAYAYVQTAEAMKQAMRIMNRPAENSDGDNSEATDEPSTEVAETD